MTPEAWLLLVGGLVVLLLAWTVWTLTRLRRLEARVARAWIALDTQLQRRAGLAEELARNYPATLGEDRAVYLAAFAADARKPVDGDREQAENLLGRELRELPERPARRSRRPCRDRPGRHPHPGRSGPAVLQRRGARHARRCAIGGCPGCCACMPPARSRDTSTSTTGRVGWPSGADGAGQAHH